MDKDLYRSRLKKPLKKAVLEFLSSIHEDKWILEEDIIGTEAHNIMLFEQGILNENEISKTLNTLENLRNRAASGDLILDENFEDVHPYIEKCVIEDVGIKVGGKIHTARSRNDQVSVDIRLRIRKELNLLTKKLMGLFEELMKVSREFLNAYMPLYTHLQRGQLGVYSHYVNAYGAQLLRSIKRIEEVYARINMNPLGACAIGGTSININRDRTTELLGFDGLIENSIDAISSRDYIYETLMLLSVISIQFSRIAEDLIIWSSKEFDYVDLDDQYCSVSSVMPQKKNPDTLELMRSKISRMTSNLFAASLTIKAIPSGYFRDFQDLKILLRDSFNELSSIIDILIGIFSTIKINRNAMKKAVEDSYILALDLAELLVQEHGIPFRRAHEIVAKLVGQSDKAEELLDIKRIQQAIFKVEGISVKLDEKSVDDLKNMEKCLNKRKSKGYPSRQGVEETIRN